MNPTEKHVETASIPTVAVVGMGYVGAVSAAGLAQRGCRVIGVESNAVKLSLLRSGRCPVREPGLAEALDRARRSGRFEVTDDLTSAVRDADVILIAVGTPSGPGGRVDLEAIERVTSQLIEGLPGDDRRRVVMIRSTVEPGTTEHRIRPLLQSSQPNVAVCHHPEFLREGSALADWLDPPMIVYGCVDADRPAVGSMIEALYQGSSAPRVVLKPGESELLKYACNLFHAMKVDFANEIGALANVCGADGAKVMDALCRDRTLNISTAYLKPGFSFGGSCLPKEARAMVYLAQSKELQLPLIGSILASNEAHLSRQVERVLRHGRRPTLLAGLSFKAGTDDLRESPMVELAERLLGKGIPLRIYDPDLLPDQLVGANQRYVCEHLPHLNLLLQTDLQEALAAAELVVIAKQVPGLDGCHEHGKMVIDLTRGGCDQCAGQWPAAVATSTRSDKTHRRTLPQAA